MRNVHVWFDNYSADHRNVTNQLIHWLCVPAILWAIIALLWLVPVPAMLGRPGLWAALAMVAAFSFYWRLSRPIGLAMVLVFAGLGVLTHLLYGALGPSMLLRVAAVVFVIAWVGQFIGHRIEGAKPTFLTDLAYLLIGPAWLAGKLMRRLRISY